ncbi:MAG TPA: hypothetical protein DC054_07795 [Blastocatellia bacterium]|nr:hypothetical protein [Blastocatellia bacterium]
MKTQSTNRHYDWLNSLASAMNGFNTAPLKRDELTTQTGDDLNCDDQDSPSPTNRMKERETEMQVLNNYETLTGRFATTMSTIVMLIGLLFLTGSAASAKTITVTGTGDTIAVDGVVTLREAITAANTNAASGDAPAGDPGLDVINFNIAGGGVKTISPTSALPIITEPITINGYTQPGASPNTLAIGDNAILLIELNGVNAGASTFGLIINAVNCTVRGLVINRFSVYGVRIMSGMGNNLIAGNFIGLDPTGTIALGNTSSGIGVNSSDNAIGGSAPADRNVISGNHAPGIFIIDGNFGDVLSNNKIQGNYIGTNAAGTAALTNITAGINIAGTDSNLVGGSNPGEGNLISGNSGEDGIRIGNSSTNTKVMGNLIGTKADGISPLGNGRGITLANTASSTIIGGTVAGSANIIAFSSFGNAVSVEKQNKQNAILGNSIFSNQSIAINGLGIDLSDNNGVGGVTPNDPGDADTGGNDLQNFPVLTSVTPSGATTTVQGTLNSTANTQFRVEVFSNTVCDPSGFGEGQKFVAFANVTTDANGDAGFTQNIPTASLVGPVFTATATDPNGNTSEFSQCKTSAAGGSGVLQFGTSMLTFFEAAGTATVTVTRTQGSTGTVKVDYATGPTNQSNKATAGTDYTTTSGQLTFLDGETSKTVSVPIIDDAISEQEEAFSMTLSNPTGGATIGIQSTVTFDILDDDAPALTINDVQVVEGNAGTTNATFTVSLTHTYFQDESVDYTSAAGTAQSGTDYQPASGTLVFLAGQTSKTITVLVNGDTTQEPDETFFVQLSNSNNVSILKSKGTATIINDDAPPAPTVQFNNASYSVQEDLGALTITVTRTGDSSAPASVDYATNDGTATQKGDFEYAAGRLTFAPGDTSKTFQVLINEDMYLEGNETFGLTLSNPVGATLGQQSTAAVSIIDDSPESLTNPIDDAQSFVYMHYHDFLNREPDQAGLAFWTNQITACGANQTCIDAKRSDVSAAFFVSIEFQQTGYLVERIYKASYGNLPGAPVPVRLSEFLPDTRAIGQGVVVGQPGWELTLENNKQAFFTEFVQRSRFALAYPSSLTPAQLVDALSANAGLLPTSADRQAAINEFAGAASTADTAARARSLRDIAENPKLAQQEFNSAFVLMQYFGYLRRDPNAAPEPGLNYGGYSFWLSKMDQFNGNYNDAEMVKAFLVSLEYRQRFGP